MRCIEQHLHRAPSHTQLSTCPLAPQRLARCDLLRFVTVPVCNRGQRLFPSTSRHRDGLRGSVPAHVSTVRARARLIGGRRGALCPPSRATHWHSTAPPASGVSRATPIPVASACFSLSNNWLPQSSRSFEALMSRIFLARRCEQCSHQLQRRFRLLSQAFAPAVHWSFDQSPAPRWRTSHSPTQRCSSKSCFAFFRLYWVFGESTGTGTL